MSTMIDRSILRTLAMQVAAAKIDGVPRIAREAQRALKAARLGDISKLDKGALSALQRAYRSEIYSIPTELEIAEMAKPNQLVSLADAEPAENAA